MLLYAIRVRLLESVRKLSIGIAQLSHHQPDGCQPDKCESVTGSVLEILGQPTAPVEPGECAFDHPASGQNLKALRRIRAFDDFDVQLRQQPGQFRTEFWPLVAAVSKELFQKWEQPEQGRQNQYPAIALLHVGRMNHGMQEQALGIHQACPCEGGGYAASSL